MFALVLLGLTLTPNRVPTLPFQTDPSHPGTPNAAFAQYAYPSDWRGVDESIEQEEPENYNPLLLQEIYGASVLSAPPESSSHTMTAGTSSSLSTEPYQRPGWQDDSADLTFFSYGRMESTSENLVAAQEQIATTQEAYLACERRMIQRKKGKDKARKQADWSHDTQEAALARERKIQRKKEMDKARKQAERDNSAEDYEKICDLLKIAMTPKNTLAHRSECFVYSSEEEVLSVSQF